MACSPLVHNETIQHQNAKLTKVIESLYNKATNAIYYNGSVGEWFRTTVGVRQGCLLSPTVFNIFLALKDYEGSVSIGGRTSTNLRFADDIDALVGKEEEFCQVSPPSGEGINNIWHGDQCRKD